MPPQTPYGLGSTRGAQIDARQPATPGRQAVLRSATQPVNAIITKGEPIYQASPFTQADQDALSSSSQLQALIGAITVAGTLPPGHTAETLSDIAAEITNIKFLVQGQLIDIVPFPVTFDTQKLYRQLRVKIDFEPGAFGGLSLLFDSLGAEMPGSGGIYNIYFNIKCIFDKRLTR